jgi:2-dehydropantoate 2-reductase
MKVGVMGAGAIGCFVGGQLASAGMDVVFVGRDRLRDELKNGLTLEDLAGPTKRVEHPVVETDPASLKGCDVVLVSVKSGQTRDVAAQLPRDAIVVSLQNGMRNADVLRESLPNVLGGIVGFNVVTLGGGRYRRATTGPLAIEDRGNLPSRIVEVLDVELVRDIKSKQWSKLVMNLNNAVSALTDRPTVELLFRPEYRRIVAAIIDEAVTILRRTNTKTARLGPLPVGLFPHVLRLPTPLLRLVAAAQLKVDPEARSSMWEDLTRGRLTEVDELNGEIVRLAEAHKLDAPINRRVVELVHDVEKRRAGSPRLSASQLYAMLKNEEAGGDRA